MSPHFADEQYRRLFEFFQTQLAKREEIRGSIELAPKDISINGSSAELADCYDAHELGSYKTGTNPPERTDQVRLERTRIDVMLTLDGAVWKVSQVTPLGSGCVPE